MSSFIIAGKGTVGRAWGKALRSYGHQVVFYDPPKGEHLDVKASVEFDGAFVCAPTPTMTEYRGERTTQGLQAVYDSLGELGKYDLPWIAVRSTVVPSSYDTLQGQLVDTPLIAHPEFLRARYAESEAAEPELMVIGGTQDNRKELLNVYPEEVRDEARIIETTFKRAFMAKYAANVLFATKVVYSYTVRGMWEEAVDSSTEPQYKLREILGNLDMVFSGRHVNPYMGDKKGFGGDCLPKDLKVWQYEGFDFIDALVEINEKWRGGEND